MTRPSIVNRKTAWQRAPFVLKGSGFLFGLNKLAKTVQKELFKSEEKKLNLDFLKEKIGAEVPIPSSICEAMRKVQVRELMFSVDTGGAKYASYEFPNKELKVAIKFALRELAMNGMPEDAQNPKTIDLSSTRKPAEKHRGYQQGIEVKSHATLYRESDWTAGLTLYYQIGTGRILLSIVNFGGKIDD